MERLYISKLVGDGVSPETRFEQAWREIIGKDIRPVSQSIESERYHFWIGILNTNDDQHALLQADARIRYIPQAILGTVIDNLTAAQKNAIAEVCSFMNIDISVWDSAHARPADVLFHIMGRACWHPISQAADA